MDLLALVGLRTFATLRTTYRARWHADLALCSHDGTPILGSGASGPPCPLRAKAIAEAERWGECVVLERNGDFIWAAPLMCNQQTLGGVIARIPEHQLFPRDNLQAALDVRAACRDLRERLEALSLTNAAFLATVRSRHQQERERAEAIHASKSEGIRDALAEYRRAEPELLRAVQAGDRAGARAILNRTLLIIYHRGHDRPALIKSLLMELVVTLCRGAVESGGRAEDLLGTNWDLLRGLHDAADEEAIARWLVAALERIMDALQRSAGDGSEILLREAVERMRRDCDQDLDRDRIASAVGLAPHALSRLLMRRYGKGFTDLLNQMRIDRAKHLLADGERSLLDIALHCGFEDPSYFTKVFRRHEGITPSEHRRRLRAP